VTATGTGTVVVIGIETATGIVIGIGIGTVAGIRTTVGIGGTTLRHLEAVEALVVVLMETRTSRPTWVAAAGAEMQAMRLHGTVRHGETTVGGMTMMLPGMQVARTATTAAAVLVTAAVGRRCGTGSMGGSATAIADRGGDE
jgi:hypothetical protein